MKNQEKIIAAVLILIFLAIMTLPLWARTTAPGAQQGPGQSQIGKRNLADRGAWLSTQNFFKLKPNLISQNAETNCCITFIMLNSISEQNIILFSHIGNIPELGQDDLSCNVVAFGFATRLQEMDRNDTSIQIIV